MSGNMKRRKLKTRQTGTKRIGQKKSSQRRYTLLQIMQGKHKSNGD